MKSGKYDHKKAPKLWMYLVDAGAKKYIKDHGSPGDKVKDMFPKKTRELVAQEFADEYKDEIEVQGGTMFDHVEFNEGTWALPKTRKQKAELKKLMAKPLPVGDMEKEGPDDITNKLYNLIGDDELFDDLYDLYKKKGKRADALPLLKKAMKRLTGYDTVQEFVELDESKMSQLHKYIKDKKSAAEIAKLMKVDVKTVKALMGDFKESARSDAMRSMRKDKDLGKRSSVEIDDFASDDDIKGASKNIIMQMRKAQSLNGRFDVEFKDRKKVKIPAKIAVAVQTKYNSFKKPRDKVKFAEKVAKSYKSMLSALKENTILGRIGKKIQERKNG